MQRKTLEPDHPQLARTLSDLGYVYYILGRYMEAEPLYRRALAILEKAGKTHESDAAITLNKLGELYRVEGRARRRDCGSARSRCGRPSWARSIPYWPPRSTTWACCIPINAGWRKPRCCFCALSPWNKRLSEWNTPRERA